VKELELKVIPGTDPAD